MPDNSTLLSSWYEHFNVQRTVLVKIPYQLTEGMVGIHGSRGEERKREESSAYKIIDSNKKA